MQFSILTVNWLKVRKFIKSLPIFLLNKRQRLVLVTILLSIALYLVQLVKVPEQRIFIILVFGIISYGLTVFALYEELSGIEWITLPVLPVTLSLTSAFFVPLLPRTIDSIFIFPLLPEEARVMGLLVKFAFWIFFAVGQYFLLLTENIYNVSAIRTIQLLRVAHAIGFLFTLIVSFFFFNILWSFQFNAIFNFLLTFVFLFPLMLQGLWSINLEDGITYSVGKYALLLSLGTSQIALVLSFWPVDPTVVSLFLTAVVYEFLGISQHHFAGRLFRRAVYEFAIVAGIVFVMMITMTRWAG